MTFYIHSFASLWSFCVSFAGRLMLSLCGFVSLWFLSNLCCRFASCFGQFVVFFLCFAAHFLSPHLCVWWIKWHRQTSPVFKMAERDRGGPLSVPLQTRLPGHRLPARPRPWHFDWAPGVCGGNKLPLRCHSWFGLCPTPCAVGSARVREGETFHPGHYSQSTGRDADLSASVGLEVNAD